MTPLDPRPRLTPVLDALLAALSRSFGGPDAAQIAVVALNAHGTVAASVRSLDPAHVSIEGKRRRWELGLRPAFFLAGDCPRRVATLAHELLHLDSDQPGALRVDYRHARKSHAHVEREARAIARRFLDEADPVHLLCLAHDGEVLMRQWRRRPLSAPSSEAGDRAPTRRRERYGDKDVFEGPLRMSTKRGARGGWW